MRNHSGSFLFKKCLKYLIFGCKSRALYKHPWRFGNKCYNFLKDLQLWLI